jgi:hypothetical protein
MGNKNEIGRVKDRENLEASRIKGMTNDMEKIMIVKIRTKLYHQR